jgi:ribosomal protein L7/L12
VTDQDLSHAQQRIAALERKVSDLYERIGKEEPQFGSADEGTGGGRALSAADQDPEIIKFVQEGKEIQAIKRYRELTGLGLAEATDAIRVLNRQHGPIDQYRG